MMTLLASLTRPGTWRCYPPDALPHDKKS